MHSYLNSNQEMDVREVACSIKHGLILETWQALQPGEFFVVRNRHEPVRIRQQIEAAFPGALQWEVLSEALGDVAVKLTKLKQTSGMVSFGTVTCEH